MLNNVIFICLNLSLYSNVPSGFPLNTNKKYSFQTKLIPKANFKPKNDRFQFKIAASQLFRSMLGQINQNLLMEEYFIMRCDYSPSFGKSPVPPPSELPINPVNTRRQVSLMYGMQFSSKVPLFQRAVSVIQQCGLAQLSSQELHEKVLTFLKEMISGSTHIRSLLASFQEMEYQMGLSVTRSQRTVSQDSSSQRSQDSFESSQREFFVFKDASNKVVDVQAEKTNKTRTSMMRKSNRISIADAIKISQLQDLKKIVPLVEINSSSSVQSQDKTSKQIQRNFDIESMSSSGHSSGNSSEIKQKLVPVCNKERSKKISIMIGEFKCNQFDSEIFSQDGEPLSLSNLKLPQLPLDISTLQLIFDSPCPFLVNLSLCLLCKCTARSQISLTESSAGWLLSTSTIVAYKIYYDQPIDGLVDYFGSILGLQNSEVAQLERWFLQTVGYEVVVSNNQYQSVLFQLVAR